MEKESEERKDKNYIGTKETFSEEKVVELVMSIQAENERFLKGEINLEVLRR